MASPPWNTKYDASHRSRRALQGLGDLVDRADARVRVGVELLGRKPEQRGHHLGRALAVVGDDRGELQHVDLEVGVAVAGCLPHPRELLVGLAGGTVLRRGGIDSAAVDRRVDPDDLRLPSRDREHPLGSAADEERRRRLHRLGQAVVLGDRVVLAGEGVGAGVEAALDHGDALVHAGHPHAGRVHRDARLVVVALHPAGADAHLEPAAGQHVDGGQLLGQHDRVLVVVVEHERTHLQLGGGVGGGHQRRDGGQLVAEVIGHEQGVVAEVLGLAGQLRPVRSGRRGAELDAEAKSSIVRHGGARYPRVRYDPLPQNTPVQHRTGVPARVPRSTR